MQPRLPQSRAVREKPQVAYSEGTRPKGTAVGAAGGRHGGSANAEASIRKHGGWRGGRHGDGTAEGTADGPAEGTSAEGRRQARRQARRKERLAEGKQQRAQRAEGTAERGRNVADDMASGRIVRRPKSASELSDSSQGDGIAELKPARFGARQPQRGGVGSALRDHMISSGARRYVACI